jgi:hypothetical protein
LYREITVTKTWDKGNIKSIYGILLVRTVF